MRTYVLLSSTLENMTSRIRSCLDTGQTEITQRYREVTNRRIKQSNRNVQSAPLKYVCYQEQTAHTARYKPKLRKPRLKR
jgi:phage terminase Nu1 subunit (DNA packaging protein)